MENTRVDLIIGVLRNLAVIFSQFNFYLFGSFARFGAGNDVDVFVEVDTKLFKQFQKGCYYDGVDPIVKAVNDPTDAFWMYFSPKDRRTEIALTILGITREQFFEMVRGLPLDIFDFIFLPKNWRDRRVMKRLKKHTDPYDENFFQNLLRDARQVDEKTSGSIVDVKKFIIHNIGAFCAPYAYKIWDEEELPSFKPGITLVFGREKEQAMRFETEEIARKAISNCPCASRMEHLEIIPVPA
jgi:hypothetical protein